MGNKWEVSNVYAEIVFAFLARCTQKTGSGAGRGEIECLDRVFKSAFRAGG